MDTYLTIIQYESTADQVFLVKNTAQIFAYFEDPVTNTNVMLAVLTDEQKNTVLSRGFAVQIVEKNPEMDTYIFLQNSQADQAKNLAGFGKVYAITGNETLVRLNTDVVFDITGPTKDFKEIPLKDIRSEIANNNNINLNTLNKEVTLTKQADTKQNVTSPNITNFVFIATLLLLIVATLIFIFWKKMHARYPAEHTDTSLN